MAPSNLQLTMFFLLFFSTFLISSQASVHSMNDQTRTTFSFSPFTPQSCSNGDLLCMGSVTASNGYLSLTPEPQPTTRQFKFGSIFFGSVSLASVRFSIRFFSVFCFSNPLLIGRVLYCLPMLAWPAFISTTFIVRISAFPNTTGAGDGMAFIFAQNTSPSPPDSYGSLLGLLDRSTQDTFMNNEFDDPYGNHIVIDTTSIINPVVAKSLNTSGIHLKSGRDIRFTIAYDGWSQILQISAGYTDNPAALISILNQSIDMSKITHQVLDWVFTSVELPGIPLGPAEKAIDLPIFLGIAILIACTYPLISKVVKRNHRDGEDIESQSRTTANAPEMFTYKKILVATQNFSKENLLGASAFGVVYIVILSSHPPKIVAVKKISTASKKGEREHLAEICTIGRLRHKNIVQLQGWCHEYGHHFLVYEYMPNRSLDQYIGKPYLDWRTRNKILTGLASTNAPRLINYNPFGRNSRVHCPRKLGLLSAKATPESDVYSFGMVVLEVVCARRSKGFMDDYTIVEHVWNSYSKNALLDCVDQTLDRKFEEEQVKRTLIIGLACLHTYSMLRPKMRKVAQILMNPNEKLFELQDTRPGPRASAVYLSVSSSAPTTEFGSKSTS
ncbi:unnamed protein product [Malus baccata var. baccata]